MIITKWVSFFGLGVWNNKGRAGSDTKETLFEDSRVWNPWDAVTSIHWYYYYRMVDDGQSRACGHVCAVHGAGWRWRDDQVLINRWESRRRRRDSVPTTSTWIIGLSSRTGRIILHDVVGIHINIIKTIKWRWDQNQQPTNRNSNRKKTDNGLIIFSISYTYIGV